MNQQSKKKRNGDYLTKSCGITTASLLISGMAFGDPYSNNAAPDDLQIYVLDALTYDNNLYRLSDDFGSANQIGEGASRDDVINRATLGGLGRAYAGRQIFEFKGRVDDNRFQENDRLDHTSGNALALWKWQLGNSMSGNLGAEYARTLGDFAYTRTLQKDLLDRQEYFLNVRVKVTPRWSLTGEGRTYRIDHGSPTAETENSKTDRWKTGVMYETPRNDSFGFEYSEGQMRLPDYMVPVGGFERDYEDKGVAGWIKYAYSPKTQFDLRLGYENREYDGTSVGNFSGTTGRASMHWEPTVKIQFDLALWRELQAYQEVGSEYFVAHGISLDSSWQPTEKFAFSLLLSGEKDEYQSDDGVMLATSSRSDELYSGTVTGSYIPRDYLSVNLSYRQLQRTSNRDLQDYDANIVTLAVRLQY